LADRIAMAIALERIALRAGAVVLTFALVVIGVRLLDGSPSQTGKSPVVAEAADPSVPPGASTDQRIEALQGEAQAQPSADSYANLGLAYLQKVRETGDPTFYSKAEGVLRRAARIDSKDFTAISGLGALALSRHDFRAGLALGQRARRINPSVARNYGVIADGQIELGRYAGADRTVQKLVNLKPELSSYARVSYFRELHGDLPGALQAMRLAVSAGGESPENVGYAQTIVGKLLLDRGRYAAAEHAYRAALADYPGYAAAQAGLARLDAGRGDYEAAIARYRRAIQRIPLPEFVIGLGETQQAAGQMAAARSSYALVRAEAKLQRANGVNTDVDLAIFEANHGSAHEAVVLGRRAWEGAPSVRSADAYAWALSRAGHAAAALRFSAEAMKLGSRDPSFLFHAGIVAKRAGRTEAARRYLHQLVVQSPRYNPLYGPRAQRALKELE
jgi:tetratricopeptide (TPR) repeat protein